MWTSLNAVAPWFTPRWQHNSSTSREDWSASERRLLAKHEQMVRLLNRLTQSGKSGIVAADLMTQQHMCTIHERDSAKYARKLFQALGTRHLLVHDDAGHLVGIINDRDVLRRRGRTARSIMTSDPLVVTPDCPAEKALSRIIRKRVSCLPVVDLLKPVGVVTRTDLLLAFEALLDYMRDHPLFASANPGAAESVLVVATEAPVDDGQGHDVG